MSGCWQRHDKPGQNLSRLLPLGILSPGKRSPLGLRWGDHSWGPPSGCRRRGHISGAGSRAFCPGDCGGFIVLLEKTAAACQPSSEGTINQHPCKVAIVLIMTIIHFSTHKSPGLPGSCVINTSVIVKIIDGV